MDDRTRTLNDLSATASVADPAATTGGDPGPPAAAPPASPVPGFDVGDEVGRGGMGVVFAAHDRELNRRVAVKVLLDKYSPGSTTARRFVAEAEITAQLQHPGVPAVYRRGELADGRPFLAMKLIKGQTLADLLAGGERPNWLGVFEAVCQAVGYAHAHGVIHRDLKPANVMVGAFGEVQVMDWGLAKVLAPLAPGGRGVGGEGDVDPDATAEPDPTEIKTLRDTDLLTHYGSLLGTPAFMAPEQALGIVDKLDRRTDVFGLGAILCALLTGKPPYVGSDRDSTRELAARAKLGDCFARLDGCGADPDLIALCKRCLGEEPADRPADARAVADAVAALRAAADERARRAEIDREKATVQAAEQAKRRRLVQWAGAITVAVLLLGVVGTSVGLWQAWVGRGQAKQAEGLTAKALEDTLVERDAARAARDRAWRVLDEMTSDVTGDAVVTQHALTPQQKQFLATAVEHYRALAGGRGAGERDRSTAAVAAVRVGQLEQALGRLPQALDTLLQAERELADLATTQPTNPEYHAHRCRALSNLGGVYTELSRDADAVRVGRTAVEVAQGMADADPRGERSRHQLGHALHNLGVATRASGRSKDSVELFDQALRVRGDLASDHPTTPKYKLELACTQNHLGMALSDIYKMDHASKLPPQALALLRPLLDANPRDRNCLNELGQCHNASAIIYGTAQKWSQAEAEVRQARGVFERLAAEHPLVPKFRIELAMALNNLGFFLEMQREKGAQAEEAYRGSLAVTRGLTADEPAVPNHRLDSARTLCNLGRVIARDARRTDEAKRRFREAVELLAALHVERPETVLILTEQASSLRQYAYFLQRAKDGEAAAAFRQLVRTHEQLCEARPASGRLTDDLVSALVGLADCLAAGDDLAGAMKEYDRALAVQPATDLRGEYGPYFAARSNRARLLGRLNRHAEAVRDWDRVVELTPKAGQPQVRVSRIASKLNAGHLAEAVAEVAELRMLPGWSAGQLYDFACVYAVASAKLADKKREHADRAVELLQQAVKAGWKGHAHMKTDTDLDPLREREDFKTLLAELEKKFPREVLPPPRRG